ncbi:hypothetical protein [Vibrio hannami]|uniref:hypothetical protein n=1 Tax=Vibrio hannami TaxID=2717094 RepID=UPI003BB21E84
MFFKRKNINPDFEQKVSGINEKEPKKEIRTPFQSTPEKKKKSLRKRNRVKKFPELKQRVVSW